MRFLLIALWLISANLLANHSQPKASCPTQLTPASPSPRYWEETVATYSMITELLPPGDKTLIVLLPYTSLLVAYMSTQTGIDIQLSATTMEELAIRPNSTIVIISTPDEYRSALGLQLTFERTPKYAGNDVYQLWFDYTALPARDPVPIPAYGAWLVVDDTPPQVFRGATSEEVVAVKDYADSLKASNRQILVSPLFKKSIQNKFLP